MTNEQEEHLARVKARFLKDVDTKYRAGQAEHGGNLWDKPGMIDMLLEEIIDFYVYAATLKEQIENVNSPELKNDNRDLMLVLSPQDKSKDQANG